MATNIIHVVDAGTPLAARTLGDLGVAPFDAVKVEAEEKGIYARLCRDREGALAFR